MTTAMWVLVIGPAIATALYLAALYLAALAIDSWAGAYIERHVEAALNGDVR